MFGRQITGLMQRPEDFFKLLKKTTGVDPALIYDLRSDAEKDIDTLKIVKIYTKNMDSQTGLLELEPSRKDGTVLFHDKLDTLHRIDGPAIVDVDKKICCWFLDGAQYDVDKYWKILEDIRSMSRIEQMIDPRGWVREMWR